MQIHSNPNSGPQLTVLYDAAQRAAALLSQCLATQPRQTTATPAAPAHQKTRP